MVLKLVGAPLSTCTRTVALVLHEKQVPFEFVPIDMKKKEHKDPKYLEKQPFGQVPYIDDDGFILYESRAISRYIEEKYPNQGTKLIPTDPKAKALFEQAASVEQNNFHPHAAAAAFEKLFKPHYGLTTDEKVVEQKQNDLAARLEVYDQILAKQEYVAGNEITLADLFHLAYGSLVPATGRDVIAEKPNVKKWFDKISARPAWQAVKDGAKGYPLK